LICSGSGGSAADSVTVNVQSAPQPTVTLSANPNQITQGGSSLLTWNSQNASTCTASGGWSGYRQLSGSETVNPAGTTTYTLTCSNSAGAQATASATVYVISEPQYPPTLTLTANPSVVAAGSPSTLNWNSANTNICTATGNWSGTKATNGSEIVYPSQTSVYGLNCQGTFGSVYRQATINVINQPQSLPTVTLTANPTSITLGQTSQLSWQSANADSCYASGGWSGSKPTAGAENAAPGITTTYSITCSNNSGAATDSVTVGVVPQEQNFPDKLAVAKLGRNLTLGQTAFVNSLTAQGLDVLEFEIKVRNTDLAAGAVVVRDFLPNGLVYVSGSTLVDGSPVTDGITSNGLYLGVLNPNEEKTIVFKANVVNGAAESVITNQAVATMNSGAQSGLMSIQIKNRGQVLGIATIPTGPEDLMFYVIIIGFLLSVAIYAVAFGKIHRKLAPALAWIPFLPVRDEEEEQLPAEAAKQ